GCPTLVEIIEEAIEDAERRGWTRLDDDLDVFELESVHLSIEGHLGNFRVTFQQPWPHDAAAPVETSDAFQNLVRKALMLAGSPRLLGKEVVVDLFEPARADRLVEWVVLPHDPQLITRFARTGFDFDIEHDAYVAKLNADDYAITSLVREDFDTVRVEM